MGRHKRRLLDDRVDDVVAALGGRCGGHRCAKIQTVRESIERSALHTLRARLMPRGLPFSFGMLDSAIQRVINPPFEGNCGSQPPSGRKIGTRDLLWA